MPLTVFNKKLSSLGKAEKDRHENWLTTYRGFPLKEWVEKATRGPYLDVQRPGQPGTLLADLTIDFGDGVLEDLLCNAIASDLGGPVATARKFWRGGQLTVDDLEQYLPAEKLEEALLPLGDKEGAEKALKKLYKRLHHELKYSLSTEQAKMINLTPGEVGWGRISLVWDGWTDQMRKIEAMLEEASKNSYLMFAPSKGSSREPEPQSNPASKPKAVMLEAKLTEGERDTSTRRIFMKVNNSTKRPLTLYYFSPGGEKEEVGVLHRAPGTAKSGDGVKWGVTTTDNRSVEWTLNSKNGKNQVFTIEIPGRKEIRLPRIGSGVNIATYPDEPRRLFVGEVNGFAVEKEVDVRSDDEILSIDGKQVSDGITAIDALGVPGGGGMKNVVWEFARGGPSNRSAPPSPLWSEEAKALQAAAGDIDGLFLHRTQVTTIVPIWFNSLRGLEIDEEEQEILALLENTVERDSEQKYDSVQKDYTQILSKIQQQPLMKMSGMKMNRDAIEAAVKEAGDNKKWAWERALILEKIHESETNLPLAIKKLEEEKEKKMEVDKKADVLVEVAGLRQPKRQTKEWIEEAKSAEKGYKIAELLVDRVKQEKQKWERNRVWAGWRGNEATGEGEWDFKRRGEGELTESEDTAPSAKELDSPTTDLSKYWEAARGDPKAMAKALGKTEPKPEAEAESGKVMESKAEAEYERISSDSKVGSLNVGDRVKFLKTPAVGGFKRDKGKSHIGIVIDVIDVDDQEGEEVCKVIFPKTVDQVQAAEEGMVDTLSLGKKKDLYSSLLGLRDGTIYATFKCLKKSPVYLNFEEEKEEKEEEPRSFLLAGAEVVISHFRYNKVHKRLQGRLINEDEVAAGWVNMTSEKGDWRLEPCGGKAASIQDLPEDDQARHILTKLLTARRSEIWDETAKMYGTKLVDPVPSRKLIKVDNEVRPALTYESIEEEVVAKCNRRTWKVVDEGTRRDNELNFDDTYEAVSTKVKGNLIHISVKDERGGEGDQ